VRSSVLRAVWPSQETAPESVISHIYFPQQFGERVRLTVAIRAQNHLVSLCRAELRARRGCGVGHSGRAAVAAVAADAADAATQPHPPCARRSLIRLARVAASSALRVSQSRTLLQETVKAKPSAAHVPGGCTIFALHPLVPMELHPRVPRIFHIIVLVEILTVLTSS
jgi:hypothetical protein